METREGRREQGMSRDVAIDQKVVGTSPELFSLSGIAAEKTDEELFFIEKGEDKEDGLHAVRKSDKLKQRQSEAHLLPQTVKTPSGRKRRKEKRLREAKKPRVESDGQNASDSREEKSPNSSDEEEYDYDSRYTHIRNQKEMAMAARVEKRLKKSRVYSVVRDIWAECKPEVSIHCKN